MKTLIYKLPSPQPPRQKIGLDEAFQVEVWRPSLSRVIPPRKGKKYIIYWIFHFLGIFKNKDYGAVLIKENGKLVASLLVVPAHFKWPFMSDKDLQFTYVLTDKEHRGKGVGFQMLQIAIKEFRKTGRSFWYVTDMENIQSKRLAEKTGFVLAGKGRTWGRIK